MTFAANALDTWHSEVAKVRVLAENDASRALDDALRLQTNLPRNAIPADRARILNLLSRIEIYRAQFTQAKIYANQAMAIATKNEDRTGQVESNLNIALDPVNEVKIDDQFGATLHSMELLSEIGKPDLLVEAMLRIVMMDRRTGRSVDSVSTSMKALEIARHANTPRALAYAYQGMAISYDQSGKVKEAVEQYTHMLEQARAIPSKLLEAEALIGLGSIATYVGNIHNGEKDIREAVAIYRSVGGSLYASDRIAVLADMLTQHSKPAAALPYFDEAIAIQELYGDKRELWWMLNSRSLAHQALGQLAAAQADAEQSYFLAKELGSHPYRSESVKRLSFIAAARGNFRQAYGFLVEAAKASRLAERERVNARIFKLAEYYQSKNHQINELNRLNALQAAELKDKKLQQYWLWSVLVGSMIILMGTIYFLRLQRSSNRKFESVNERLVAEITERKHVEEQHALLGLAINHAHDAIYLGDDNQHIFYVNDEACRMLGYSREEILHMTILDIDPHFEQVDIERIKQQIRVAGYATFETQHKHKNGTNIPVEITATSIEFSGKTVHLSLVRDISERKHAEAEISARERKFRTLAESLPDNIVRYNQNAQIIYVNPILERTLGSISSELLGTSPRERLLGGEFEEYTRLLSCVLATGEAGEIEMILPSSDMRTNRVHQIRMIAERDVNGKVIGALAIGRDITERKLAELELKESRAQLRGLTARREEVREEERKHIARELHDELGQILTALQLNVSVLKYRFSADSATLHEQLSDTMELTDTALAVVRNVASMLRPAALDMGIVSALEWVAGRFASNTGIDCKVGIEVKDIDLDEVYAIALFRIVQESLTNISRHAKANHVMVKLNREGNNYILKVSDNGIGFDPSKKMISSFGLVGIRERASMLGGSFSINSNPGKGTEVEVQIPVTCIPSEES